MLLTITTTHKPATDLGFLLHKHPDKFQSVDLSMGKAYIFYPESSEDKTTVALLLDIDSIDMVKGARKRSGKGFSLGQYVNDRPYVASSFMSVGIAKAFSTAMNGRCKNKPELVTTKMPLEAKISILLKTCLPIIKCGEIRSPKNWARHISYPKHVAVCHRVQFFWVPVMQIAIVTIMPPSPRVSR